jgi:hypothetical protein
MVNLEELIGVEISSDLVKRETCQVANITLQNGLKVEITVPYDVFEWFVNIYGKEGNVIATTWYDHYGDKKENLEGEMSASIFEFIDDVTKNESRIIPKQKSTGNIFQIMKDNQWQDYI